MVGLISEIRHGINFPVFSDQMRRTISSFCQSWRVSGLENYLLWGPFVRRIARCQLGRWMSRRGGWSTLPASTGSLNTLLHSRYSWQVHVVVCVPFVAVRNGQSVHLVLEQYYELTDVIRLAGGSSAIWNLQKMLFNVGEEEGTYEGVLAESYGSRHSAAHSW